MNSHRIRSGISGGRLYSKSFKKNMVFGMTWGRAMHEFVEQLAKDERLRSLSFQNVKIVPFLGTPGVTQSDSWNTTTYSNTLATKVGNLLHCASYNLSNQCMWKVQKKRVDRLMMKFPKFFIWQKQRTLH